MNISFHNLTLLSLAHEDSLEFFNLVENALMLRLRSKAAAAAKQSWRMQEVTNR